MGSNPSKGEKLTSKGSKLVHVVSADNELQHTESNGSLIQEKNVINEKRGNAGNGISKKQQILNSDKAQTTQSHREEHSSEKSQTHPSDEKPKNSDSVLLQHKAQGSDTQPAQQDVQVITTQGEGAVGSKLATNMEEQMKETEEKQDGNPLALTSEEKEKIKEESFRSLRRYLSIVGNMTAFMDENGVFTQTFKLACFQVQKLHFALKGAPLSEYKQYQCEEGAVLAENGGVESIIDVILYCMKKGYYGEDSKVIPGIWNVLVNSIIALLNFTDRCPKLTYHVADHPQYLDFVAEHLLSQRTAYIEGQLQEKETKIISYLLSILHNVAQAEDHTERIRSFGFVEILFPYLNSTVDKTILSTLATLADILDESEAKKLESNQEFFKKIIKFLSRSLKDSKRRYQGWSAAELARTVRRLGRSDSNKRALVCNDCLPVLVELSESEDVDERTEAVGALWTLTFNEDNQVTMINGSDKVIEVFLQHRYSKESKIKKSCYGALWNMRQKLQDSEKYKEIGHEYMRGEKDADIAKQNQKGHVMISYQWAHQNLVKEVRDALRKNNIKVWMDIDDMEGSTLNAMARAVEEAEIVLVCYSNKYKDSDNCRSEAEYAFQMKKKIIPVKMEPSYKPDGWLGFIIGTKLFYDFSGKYTFESRVEGLVKEIYKHMEKEAPAEIIVPHSVKTTTAARQEATPTTSLSSAPRMPVRADGVVKNWEHDDVKKWITKHNLPAKKFDKLTGVEVAFLQVLRQESPDNFYKVLSDMMKINDLITLAKFTFALEDTAV